MEILSFCLRRSQKPDLIHCNFYRKLKSESESVRVELEKVFGPDVELEGLEKESVDQENSSDTAVVVLGVMLALSIISLITLVVVGVIK